MVIQAVTAPGASEESKERRGFEGCLVEEVNEDSLVFKESQATLALRDLRVHPFLRAPRRLLTHGPRLKDCSSWRRYRHCNRSRR